MKEPLDLSKVSENDRLAFYGALFAITFLDSSISGERIAIIFEIMNLDNMADFAKQEVYSYIVEPPSLWICLNALKNTDERLRYGLMINLVEIVWTDGELNLNEGKAVGLAQQELMISNERLEAIKSFTQTIKETRVRGLDDRHAVDAMKLAASGLSGLGIPVGAIYLSGSVIGLSAAGITSGLAGLGALVGLGAMIPGVGIAIILGGGAFAGANLLLDTGDKRKKAKFKAEKERRTQIAIRNVKGAVDQLSAEIFNLQEKPFSIFPTVRRARREKTRALNKRRSVILNLLDSLE